MRRHRRGYDDRPPLTSGMASFVEEARMAQRATSGLVDSFAPVTRTKPESQGSGQVSASLFAGTTEINPTHRQFLHPHTLLDLARDPPFTPPSGRLA